MSMRSADDYFHDPMPARQVLVWALAVRRQLERWEPLVAKHTLMMLEPNLHPRPQSRTKMSTTEYWAGETERHLLLIAARQLLRTLSLLEHPPTVSAVMSAELKETRDLSEHWDENMPIFQVSTRPREPKWKPGKDFASRNPQMGPYCWWAWDSTRGPLVTPNVSATEVHDLVESAITAVLTDEPDFEDGVADPAPRPWTMPLSAGGGWFPKLD